MFFDWNAADMTAESPDMQPQYSWLHLLLKNELYRKWLKQCLSSPGAVMQPQKSSC